MSKKPTQAEPDETDLALIACAEELFGDHFFDPDAEDEYKRKHAANRGRQEITLLREETLEVLEGACTIRLEALRTWTSMRMTLLHADFAAVAEGMWSFDNQELRKPAVTQRDGDTETIEAAVEEILDHVSGAMSDEDLLAEMGLDAEEDAEEPLIGDDPKEPPPATGTDRGRVKAIAKRFTKAKGDLSMEDRSWLEQTPQVLPVLADIAMGFAADTDLNDPLLDAYLTMLGMQLEFVRYRQDRGWDWASAMLEDFQEKLLEIGQRHGNTQVFMAMGAALVRARVPVSEPMREALAQAGMGQEEVEPSGDLDLVMDSVMAQLADAVESPFDVTGSLSQTGAILPAALRGFLASKLALSEHQVIRDSAALLLLDEDATVRQAAVHALSQAAAPETMSPETLRRAVTIRNWAPESERAGIDAVVRKARASGVAIASWPEGLADTEFHASMVDGSAAQSILMVSRSGKKFVFSALLFRHGEGVIDAWEDADLSRTKVQGMLREARMAGPSTRAPRGFVDTLVRHALGASAGRGAVPPETLLQVAENIRAAEWQATTLDVGAEVGRRVAEAAPAAAAMAEAAAWLNEAETLRSWFEEGPEVHGVLSRLPRNRRPALVAAVLNDILPTRRAVWAERFLLMTLWCEAAQEAVYHDKAPAMLAVAHALATDVPMEEIPAMRVIADHTVTSELVTPW